MSHQKAKEDLKKLLSIAVEGDVEAVKRAVQSVAKESHNGIKDVLDGFKDGHGCTALWFASMAGKHETVAYLLTTGCDLESLNNQGESCLMIAASRGHVGTCQLLINAKAAVTHQRADKQTSLHLAAQHGHLDVVGLLLDHGADLHAQGALGTPLHAAVAEGSEEVCQLLVSRKADIHCTGAFPLLHFASGMGRVGVLRLLLQAGCNINGTTEEGQTPLMDAAEAGQAKAVKALLDAKANPDLENRDGTSALDLAVYGGLSECVELLRSVSTRKQVSSARPARGGQGGGQAAAASAPTETVSEEDAKEAERFKTIGNEAFRVGKNEAALTNYTQAIAKDPTQAAVFSNRCAVYLRLKRHDEALADAKEACRLSPEWTKAHYREGEAYRALGDLAEAAASFWEAMKLDGNNKDARRQFEEIKREAEDARSRAAAK